MDENSKLCKACGTFKKVSTNPEESEFYQTKTVKGKAYFRSVCKECNLLESRGVKIERRSSGLPVKDADHFYTQSDLSDAMLDLSRHDLSRLELLDEKTFRAKTKASKALRKLAVPFKDIKEEAMSKMEARGLCTPESLVPGDGTYLIVSDSHGKHTKHRTFDMLLNVCRHMKVDRVIHLGHLLDDDDMASYRWKDFANLTVVAKPEELSIVHRQGYDVVRDHVRLGDITVTNQEHITDYRHTSLRTIDVETYPGTCIVNLHRMERMPRCSSGGRTFIASPGCLCEPHIIKTVKQIDFSSGGRVVQSYPSSFHKYRKARHDMNLWKQGLILVRVLDGKGYILQTSVKDTGATEKATAIFNSVVTTKGVYGPDSSTLIVADTHSPLHDLPTVSLQMQVGKAYRPDALVDLGDTIAFNSVNHHDIDRGFIQSYANVDMLQETAAAHYVLALRAGLAAKRYFFSANHERFMQDFVRRNPQFATLFTMDTLLGLSKEGYNTVNYKQPLRLGAFIFCHGDFKLFGMSGCLHDRLADAFQPKASEELVFGHVHYASHRNQTSSIGLSGSLDQLYNEAAVSTWTLGFGWGVSYRKCAFIQLIDNVAGSCWFDEVYRADPGFKVPALKTATLSYNYQGGN